MPVTTTAPVTLASRPRGQARRSRRRRRSRSRAPLPARAARGSPCTRSTESAASSGPSPAVGSTSPSRRQSTVATASIAPALPSRWPTDALVAVSGSRAARSPKTLARAAASASSFRGVPVPCTLTNATASRSTPASSSARRMASAAPTAFRLRGRHVVRVAGCPGTAQLRDRPGIPRAGVCLGLEHQHRRTLAERHARAVGAEGPAGALVDRAQRVEARVGELAERVGSAGDGDVHDARAQVAQRRLDGERGGGARGGDRDDRAAHTQRARHGVAGAVELPRREEVATRAATLPGRRQVLLGLVDPRGARAEVDTHAGWKRRREPGLRDRLPGREEREAIRPGHPRPGARHADVARRPAPRRPRASSGPRGRSARAAGWPSARSAAPRGARARPSPRR